MGVEYEWKFRGTPALLQQIDAAIPGQRQTVKMQTTYYDTPDGKLSARYYTLRCRMENDRAVCTLKAPHKDGGRGEWELDCGRIETAIRSYVNLALRRSCSC